MTVSPNMRGHMHVCIFNLESGMAIYTKSICGQNAEGLSWYEKRSEKGPMANCHWNLFCSTFLSPKQVFSEFSKCKDTFSA